MQLDIQPQQTEITPADAPDVAANRADDDNGRWMETVKAGVLLGLCGYFVYNIAVGDLANYINLRFMWLTYVAVALFGLLGIVSVISLIYRDYNNITSDHTLIRWDVILIMALPLLFGTLTPSQPLGASAIRDNLSFQTASFGVVQVAEKDPLDRNALDWVRTFAQPNTHPSTFDGLEADFIGFIISDPTYPPGHLVVARSVVRCCVVDIEGIGIPMAWEGADDLREDTWVRVRGVFEAGTFLDQRTPILQATDVEIVPQPDQPYLYP